MRWVWFQQSSEFKDSKSMLGSLTRGQYKKLFGVGSEILKISLQTRSHGKLIQQESKHQKFSFFSGLSWIGHKLFWASGFIGLMGSGQAWVRLGSGLGQAWVRLGSGSGQARVRLGSGSGQARLMNTRGLAFT